MNIESNDSSGLPSRGIAAGSQAHHENRSIDSVHTEQHGITNIVRNILGGTGRDFFVSLLLAVSIAVNIWCAMEIRDTGMEQRLKQYNLDWFKTHEFSDLKAEVEVNQKLITAFGPQTCKPK